MPDDSQTMPDAPPSCGTSNFVLAFNGSQYVQVPDSTLVDPPGDLTVEAWTRFDGVTNGGYNCVVIKTVGTGTADSYSLWYDGGGLHSAVGLGLPNSVSTTYQWSPMLGGWYHLAMSFALATHDLRLYVNGSEVAVLANSQTTPSYDNHLLTIGSDFGNNAAVGFFVGLIDEVRIWSVVRTPQQIMADAASCASGPQTGLAAYWQFNEDSGQFVQDASGNGNRGTLGATQGNDSTDPSWILSTEPFGP